MSTEQNAETWEAARDLDVVHCRIYFPPESNSHLVKSWDLSIKMTEEAVRHLEELGVECETYLPPQFGAGPLPTILSTLWGLLVSGRLIAVIKMFYSFVSLGKNFRNGHITSQKPVVLVSLALQTDKPFHHHDRLEVPGRLINLKLFSDSLVRVLQEKYDVFNFDQVLIVSLKNKDFHITYSIPRKYSKSIRLKRMFNAFRITSHEHVEYVFSKFGRIRIKKCSI